MFHHYFYGQSYMNILIYYNIYILYTFYKITRLQMYIFNFILLTDIKNKKEKNFKVLLQCPEGEGPFTSST